MNIFGIGINADSTRIDGRLDVFKNDLERFEEVGFDYVELPIHGLDLLINGKLNKEQLNLVKEIIKDFPFKYTVHCPDKLNLMSCYANETHRDALKATIEFAGEIGAETVVYHSSCAIFIPKLLCEHYYPKYGTMNCERLFDILCEKDMEYLYEAGDYAKKSGVTVAVENLWYESLVDIYTYGVYAEDLLSHVKDINHPNIGITYDFGHAYINSKIYKFDYIESIKTVTPHLKHVHVHDNFGKADKGEKYIDRLPFGYGDIHLPPGLGDIPYNEVIKVLDKYSGVFTMEIEPRYSSYYNKSLNTAKNLIKK
jgi:sugar phosphate isomerase/epimerase